MNEKKQKNTLKTKNFRKTSLFILFFGINFVGTISESQGYEYRVYDENGNQTSVRNCGSFDSTGKCVSYSNWGDDFVYDQNTGNKLQKACSYVDISGNCTSYYWNRIYLYDKTTGKETGHRTCTYNATYDIASGTCSSYSDSYDYTYDKTTGNKTSERYCKSLDSTGKCTSYDSGYDYTYDKTTGNKTSERRCSSIDSTGKCTSYSSGYEYTYDPTTGNKTSYRKCASYDSTGKCTSYSEGYDYTYTYDQTTGNKTSERYCNSLARPGMSTSYSSCYEYTYDPTTGNETSHRKCASYDNSTGKCTSYSYGTEYTYDKTTGKMTSERRCDSFDSTGKCTSYDSVREYDENGNLIYSCSVSSNSGGYMDCTKYGLEYDKDDNLIKKTRSLCSFMSYEEDYSAENCSNEPYLTETYDYDEYGNKIAEYYDGRRVYAEFYPDAYYNKRCSNDKDCSSCRGGYLEKNGICISPDTGCGENWKNMGGWCNRVRYTPAEAAEILKDDNNEVTITFKK